MTLLSYRFYIELGLGLLLVLEVTIDGEFLLGKRSGEKEARKVAYDKHYEVAV